MRESQKELTQQVLRRFRDEELELENVQEPVVADDEQNYYQRLVATLYPKAVSDDVLVAANNVCKCGIIVKHKHCLSCDSRFPVDDGDFCSISCEEHHLFAENNDYYDEDEDEDCEEYFISEL